MTRMIQGKKRRMRSCQKGEEPGEREEMAEDAAGCCQGSEHKAGVEDNNSNFEGFAVNWPDQERATNDQEETMQNQDQYLQEKQEQEANDKEEEDMQEAIKRSIESEKQMAQKRKREEQQEEEELKRALTLSKNKRSPTQLGLIKHGVSWEQEMNENSDGKGTNMLVPPRPCEECEEVISSPDHEEKRKESLRQKGKRGMQEFFKEKETGKKTTRGKESTNNEKSETAKGGGSPQKTKESAQKDAHEQNTTQDDGKEDRNEGEEDQEMDDKPTEEDTESQDETKEKEEEVYIMVEGISRSQKVARQIRNEILKRGDKNVTAEEPQKTIRHHRGETLCRLEEQFNVKFKVAKAKTEEVVNSIARALTDRHEQGNEAEIAARAAITSYPTMPMPEEYYKCFTCQRDMKGVILQKGEAMVELVEEYEQPTATGILKRIAPIVHAMVELRITRMQKVIEGEEDTKVAQARLELVAKKYVLEAMAEENDQGKKRRAQQEKEMGYGNYDDLYQDVAWAAEHMHQMEEDNEQFADNKIAEELILIMRDAQSAAEQILNKVTTLCKEGERLTGHEKGAREAWEATAWTKAQKWEKEEFCTRSEALMYDKTEGRTGKTLGTIRAGRKTNWLTAEQQHEHAMRMLKRFELLIAEKVSRGKMTGVRVIRLCTQYNQELMEQEEEDWTIPDGATTFQDIPLKALHEILKPHYEEVGECVAQGAMNSVGNNAQEEWKIVQEIKKVGTKKGTSKQAVMKELELKLDLSTTKHIHQNKSADQEAKKYWHSDKTFNGAFWSATGLKVATYHVPLHETDYMEVNVEGRVPNQMGIEKEELPVGLEAMDDVRGALHEAAKDVIDETTEEMVNSNVCAICRGQMGTKEQLQEAMLGWTKMAMRQTMITEREDNPEVVPKVKEEEAEQCCIRCAYREARASAYDAEGRKGMHRETANGNVEAARNELAEECIGIIRNVQSIVANVDKGNQKREEAIKKAEKALENSMNWPRDQRKTEQAGEEILESMRTIAAEAIKELQEQRPEHTEAQGSTTNDLQEADSRIALVQAAEKRVTELMARVSDPALKAEIETTRDGEHYGWNEDAYDTVKRIAWSIARVKVPRQENEVQKEQIEKRAREREREETVGTASTTQSAANLIMFTKGNSPEGETVTVYQGKLGALWFNDIFRMTTETLRDITKVFIQANGRSMPATVMQLVEKTASNSTKEETVKNRRDIQQACAQAAMEAVERQAVAAKAHEALVLKKLQERSPPLTMDEVVDALQKGLENEQGKGAGMMKEYGSRLKALKWDQFLLEARDWAVFKAIVTVAELELIQAGYQAVCQNMNAWTHYSIAVDQTLNAAYMTRIAAKGTRHAQAEREAEQLVQIGKKAVQGVEMLKWHQNTVGLAQGSRTSHTIVQMWIDAVKKTLTQGLQGKTYRAPEGGQARPSPNILGTAQWLKAEASKTAEEVIRSLLDARYTSDEKKEQITSWMRKQNCAVTTMAELAYLTQQSKYPRGMAPYEPGENVNKAKWQATLYRTIVRWEQELGPNDRWEAYEAITCHRNTTVKELQERVEQWEQENENEKERCIKGLPKEQYETYQWNLIGDTSIKAKWLAYTMPPKERSDALYVTKPRQTTHPQCYVLTKPEERPFSDTKHMRRMGKWAENDQLYQDEESALLHENASADRIIVHKQVPGAMTIPMEWKDVEIMQKDDSQKLYIGRPGTENPVDYELANSAAENLKRKTDKTFTSTQAAEYQQATKTVRVHMPHEGHVWKMQTSVRATGQGNTITTSEIVATPGQDHTVVMTHVPLLEPETMEKGEGAVLAGATSVTVKIPREEYVEPAKAWELDKNINWRYNPTKRELKDMVEKKQVSGKEYEDLTLRVMTDGSYKLGLCHQQGDGRIWQYIDTAEGLITYAKQMINAKMHYVAVTVQETAPGAMKSDMEATILTEEGMQARGKIRKNMPESGIKRMRGELPTEMVAARVHHKEGLGLKYEGLILDHACITAITPKQAQKVLKQLQRKQEVNICEQMQAIMRQPQQPRSLKRKMIKETKEDQTEEQKEEMKEQQEQLVKRTRKAEALNTKWNTMTTQAFHEAMKEAREEQEDAKMDEE